jgi:uncharacterized protein YbjQ (UPF0145 family)
MSNPEPWITPASQQRLADTASGTCFTSDLSVDEFVLVHQSGFEALGLVVGSSMYHVGIQVARWGSSQELTTLTQAMYNGRELAMERMTAEANQLGADGIVGVQLSLNMYAGGHEVMEFLATGTAVRSRSHPGAFRAPSGRPFTSDLSGQDFYKLLRAGWLPTSFVFGTCVYHVAHQGALQSLRQLGQNVEMPQYTQAVYDARELAVSRLQTEGERSGGAGIVGVQLSHASHVWGEHAIEFLGVGTAVRTLGDTEPMPAPTLVLPLQ